MTKIQKAIESSELTLTEIANRSGLSRQAIYLWLTEGTMPTYKSLVKLAKALDMKVEDLV